MRGLMMDRPLLISSILDYAARYHGGVEIVSRSVEGPIHRTTYGATYARTQQLAHALAGLGVGLGDRVATLAWNGYRHLELYYAISGIGAVCHTVNPRLFPEQIVHVLNHAADRFLFVDLTFVPLVEAVWSELNSIEGVVLMSERAHMPETTLPEALCYEELLAGQPERFDWPQFDETTAAALCYTSGTTGMPKGVLYSHRSTLLHALALIVLCDGTWSTSRDSYLVVVPMFHVNAWGIPYGCPLTGTKLVFPGPRYDAEAIYELLESEKVTMTAGVPTVWLALLQYLRETGKTLPHLERLVCGGAPPPASLIRALEEDYGVEFMHGWGMTETSPVGTICVPRADMRDAAPEERLGVKCQQGRPSFGYEIKIVDDQGRRLPEDGEASGELLVRGPWVASGYFHDEEASAAAFDAEGWFRTGDVATIDASGYMNITDRTKDLIKSGGEWISSIELEDAVMAYPEVAEAAAIAASHPRWGERPLVVAVAREGASPSKEAILGFLAGKVAKWWLPDDVIFVEELPHTATGKVSKAALRRRFKDHRLPTA